MSKADYTSKDYTSILQDLLNNAANLSKVYNPQSENDPATFLLKTDALIGDMLSYYLDKQSLEVAPRTMTQRKVAYEYYKLLNYYMSWWRPAKCTITLKNETNNAFILKKYTSFESQNSGLSVITIEDQVVKANSETLIECYEGRFGLQSVNSINIVDNELSLVGLANRLMIESTEIVTDNSANWVRVDDIDRYSALGRYYDVSISEYDEPYVRFSSYLSQVTDKITGVKYIYSAGIDTSIIADDFKNPTSNQSTYNVSLNPKIRLENSEVTGDYAANLSSVKFIGSTGSSMSTQGPETPAEAYENSHKYINTNDTLVTTRDYVNAILRMSDISNCVVTDFYNEPNISNPQDTVRNNGGSLEFNQYRIRYIYQNHNSYGSSSGYDSNIDSRLRDYSCIRLSSVFSHSNDMFIHEWMPKGTITLSSKVSRSESDNILAKICQNLARDYHPEKMSFGTPISLVDLVNKIKSYDERILLVDIKPISYKILNYFYNGINGNCDDALVSIIKSYVDGLTFDGGGYSPINVNNQKYNRHWTLYNLASNPNSGYRITDSNNFSDISSAYTKLASAGITTDDLIPDQNPEILDPLDFFQELHPWRSISIPRFKSYLYLSGDKSQRENALNEFKSNVIINKESIY